jgi:hypothetical protein
MKVLLLAFVFLPLTSLLHVVPIDDAASARDLGRTHEAYAECTGCFGSETLPYSNDPCITITHTGVDCQDGACTGETSPCLANGCVISGTITVTMGSSYLCVIYRRARINDTCVPGVEVYQPSSSDTFEYDEQILNCGITFYERFCTSDPGSTCNINAAAGWSFTCTECAFR